MSEELNPSEMGTDAAAWAREFCKRWPSALCQIPGHEGVQDGDDFEATVLGWFANAIETARDIERRTPPRVKALVWKDPGTGFEKAEPFGLLEYEVGSAEEDGGEGFFWYEYLSDKYVTGFVDEAAAKAAAQADFTSRVHACLEGYDD